MEKYYHFTKYENLESILNSGLIPQVGPISKSIGEQRVAVFLSEGIISAVFMQLSLQKYYNKYKDKQIVQAINELYESADKKRNANGGRFEVEKDEQEYNLLKKQKNRCELFAEYQTFKDYIGEGVFLCLENIDNVKGRMPNGDSSDCWVNETIPPEKIKVVLLKNKTTGELKDSIDDIRYYFFAITPCSQLFIKSIEIYYNVSLALLLEEYYENNEKELQEYKDTYELIEIPLEEYYEYMNRFHI